MDVIINDETKDSFIIWSEKENAIRNCRIRRKKLYSQYKLNFKDALLWKLHKSVFGNYLNIFNPQQTQDKFLNENKLEIMNWDHKNMSGEEMKKYLENNRIFDGAIDYLKTFIKDGGTVTWEHLKETIQTLRLNACYIKEIDASLRKFANLQVLMLSGNSLRSCKGSFLPRKLKFLELYDNFLDSMDDLIENAPRGLLHLGLGRNNLSDASSLHMLAKSRNFEQLRSLDLSDNDIYQQTDVLKKLKDLKSIVSLQLEGNPCYVNVTYKANILYYFPKLIYLDNIKVSKEDRINKKSSSSGDEKPRLIFYCYRIMGLHPPPKDNKHIQTIHLEFDLPLLERPHLEKIGNKDVQYKEDESDKKIQGSKKSKKKKNNIDEGKISKETADKKSNRSRKSSPYDKPNEYYAELGKSIFSFKTDKMPWANIIEFPPVSIESPEHNLAAIRDTLRSCVNIRVVYLKVLPHAKEKKMNQLGKQKRKKFTKNPQKMHSDNEVPDTIVKRVTLCRFKCDLSNINWSDGSIDFYWADYPKIGSTALKVDGCLKDIFYKVPKKLEAKIKRKNKSTENVQIPVPKIFTCQVGFGLWRDP